MKRVCDVHSYLGEGDGPVQLEQFPNLLAMTFILLSNDRVGIN